MLRRSVTLQSAPEAPAFWPSGAAAQKNTTTTPAQRQSILATTHIAHMRHRSPPAATPRRRYSHLGPMVNARPVNCTIPAHVARFVLMQAPCQPSGLAVQSEHGLTRNIAGCEHTLTSAAAQRHSGQVNTRSQTRGTQPLRTRTTPAPTGG